MAICTNCNTTITDNFCPHCGAPAKIKRIDRHYLVHEVVHVLHFEKGLLYTIRELLIRPGKNVKEFLLENRNRMVRPILFITITSLVYTLIVHFFHIDEGYVAAGGEGLPKNSAVMEILEWIQNHYGYANIIMGIFIAFWLKLFFRKYDYNYFEILILLCFTMGMGMLIFATFALVGGILNTNLMQAAGLVGLVYCCWAIARFFDTGKASSYIKAAAAYVLGMIVFILGAVVLGILWDSVLKR